MRRTTQIFLAVIAGVLALQCVRRHAELNALRAEVARLQSSAVSVRVAGPDAPVAPALEPPAVESAPGEPEAAAPTGEVQRIRIRERAREELVRMLNDPRRKRFMEASWTLQLDSVYGPLFRYYEMTPEELRYFQSLLVEKGSLGEGYAMRLLEAGRDGAALAAARAAQDRLEHDFNGRMREFLGDNAYAEYEGYDRSLPERVMLTDYKRALASSGAPLTYGQEDALIRILYEERENLPQLRQFMQGRDPLAQVERDRAEKVLRDFDAGRGRMISRAAGQLTPEQYGSFTNYVGQLRDRLEVGLTVQSGLLAPK